MTMLQKVKAARRIAADVTTYDDELNGLIEAAAFDLGIAGALAVDEYDSAKEYAPGDRSVHEQDLYICISATTGNWSAEAWQLDPLYVQAVITYARAHFGSPEDYDRLKASYDEQKAQLQMATGYTDWGAIE